MAASPSWYADPGGQPGLYRYWDGRNWSATVSPNPAAPPPPGALGAPSAAPTGPAVPAVPAGTPPTHTPGQPSPYAPRKRAWGWLIAVAAILIALVVAAVLIIPRVVSGGGGGTAPGGGPSTDVCPRPDNGSPEPQPGDGRVHAGKISYPELGSPWSTPAPEDRVAFGKGVLLQSVVIEQHGEQQWLAAVLVGELVAGDGFFTPKDGAAIVVRCVTGTFYGNSAVTRDDKRNEAMTVDGHQAWVIESELGFNVPNVDAKHERLIVVIIDTGTGTSGLFYASIPENAHAQLLTDARQALAGVKVG